MLSVEANTGASRLKEWFAPIFYDTAAVSYVRYVRGPLWLDLIVTDEVSVLLLRPSSLCTHGREEGACVGCASSPPRPILSPLPPAAA